MSSSENLSEPITIRRDSSDCVSESCPSGTFSWTPTAAGQEVLAALPDKARVYVIDVLTGLAHTMTMTLGGLVNQAAQSPQAFYASAQMASIVEMMTVAKLQELSGDQLGGMEIIMLDLGEATDLDMDDIDENTPPEEILRRLGL